VTRLSRYIINTIIILGFALTSIAYATTGNSGASDMHGAAHHAAGRTSHRTMHTSKTTKAKSVKHKVFKTKPIQHSKPRLIKTHKIHKTPTSPKVLKPTAIHKIHSTKHAATHHTNRHKSKLAKHKSITTKHHVNTTKPQQINPIVTVQAPLQTNAVSEQHLSLNSLSPVRSDGQRLVSFVHEIVSSLRYTRYASGAGTFDSKYGVYKLDCSHYVDNILHRVNPRAYASLETATGAQMPNSANYYDFFTRLSSDIRYDWNKVDNARELQPGDVLVFRYKSSSGEAEGGHVMVVMNKPVQDNDALLVQVSDSASAGHSDDTRPVHNSGVGIGTLLLKVDSYTGQPSAYAWEFNAPWKNVNIAMARPSDFG
jgi:cell wall-associated NlpC family hydrolase